MNVRSITSFDSELVAKVIQMSIELFRQQERFTLYRFSFFCLFILSKSLMKIHCMNDINSWYKRKMGKILQNNWSNFPMYEIYCLIHSLIKMFHILLIHSFLFKSNFLCEIQLKPLLLIFKTWRNRDSNTQFSSVTVVIWCLRIYQTQGIQSLCFYVKNNVFWLNVMGERLFLLLEYIIQESIIIEKTYNSFAFKTWVIRPFLNLNIE